MDITFTEKITRDPVRLMEQLNQLSLGVEGLGKPVKQIQQQITILSSTVSGALKVNVEDNSGAIIGTQPTIQILNSATPALTWTITDDPSNTRVKILPVLTTSPALAAIVVGTGRQLTINGTANRITSSAGAQDLSADRTWTIDIAATYVGQSSITTLGTIVSGVWNGTTIAIANGGTGQTTANAALNALLPNQATHAGEFLTTDGANTSWAAVSGGSPHNLLSATHSDTLTDSVVLGDIVHGNATPKWARLAGNITTTKMFLTQTGTGAISAAPAWGTILAADIGSGANLSVGTSLQFTAGTGTGVLLAAATVDTIQDIRITAAPQWTRLGIGAAASATNLLTFTQAASSGATGISALVLTGGAHTTLTNAEAIDVNFNLARTVQFAGNVTLAEQRAVVIGGVTYTSDTATKTITNVATVYIGEPVAGTNVIITNPRSLRVAGITELTDLRLNDILSMNSLTLSGSITWTGNANILLYSNNASQIQGIPHVAAGQVLTSAGTATAPAWSASPSLTALTLSGFTQGSVIFAGSGGLLSQDNANFFWNDTDNRLGIGTASPSFTFVVDTSINGLAAGQPTIVLQGSANKERFSVRSFGASPAPGYEGVGAGGTVASPTATTINSFLCFLGGGGYDNAGTPAITGNKALFSIKSEQAFTTTAQGTYFTWETTAAGGTTRTEKMRLSSVGYLGIGGTPFYPLDIRLSGSGVKDMVTLYNTQAQANGNGVQILFFANAETSGGGSNQSTQIAGITSTISGATVADNYAGDLRFFTLATGTTLVERLRMDASGNVGIAATSFGTSAAKVLGIGSGTAPSTSPADMIQMWSADRGGVAGAASLHIRTEDATSHVIGDRIGFGTTTPVTFAEFKKNQGAPTYLTLTNSTAGTTSEVKLSLVSDTNVNSGVGVYSSTTTAAGIIVANAFYTYTDHSAGMAVVSAHASGGIKFATGGLTAKMTLTSAGNLDLVGKLTTYLNVATTNNGVGFLVASSNLTAQGAAIGATTIYAVPAAGVGLYRISWVATITRAATTSCTLGGSTSFQVIFTDQNDSVVKTSNPTAVTNFVSSVNATGTTVSGVFCAYCKASTNLQYAFGYTSSGATTMQYDLSIRVEFIG